MFATESSEAIPLCPAKVDADNTIEDIVVTEIMVRKELERLNMNKSAGPDGIPGIILKKCADELALPLARLFNKSLEEGCLPQEWKRARVVPNANIQEGIKK